MKPILHLNLKKKWYDMIESREKKEEYRDMSLYWAKKFIVIKISPSITRKMIIINNFPYRPDEVTICFSNGYSKTRRQMFIKCNGLRVGHGKEEWGAENGKYYFVLSLGEKL
jgi:hypothetical protein